MKKIACFLLALSLLLSVAGAAFAASVSITYQDGSVTVTSYDSGFFEIYIDGVNTYHWVGATRPVNTFPWPLEDGEHTVRLSSRSYGSGSTTFRVGNQQGSKTAAPEGQATPKADDGSTPAPTATPAPTPDPVATHKGPIKIYDVSYAAHSLRFTAAGIEGYAEIWVDGESTRRNTKTNGESIIDITLEAGSHTLMLYSPLSNKLDRYTFDVIVNPYGDIMKDANGLSVDYEAEYTDETELVLRADLFNKEEKGIASQISLYLDQVFLAELRANGMEDIVFENDAARLMIQLSGINSNWFGEDASPDTFVFTTDPAAEGGVLVKVEGMTGEEKLEASIFSGLMLLNEEGDVSFSTNGVY